MCGLHQIGNTVFRKQLHLRLIFVLLAALFVVTIPQSSPTRAACAIGGEVYRDYNATGLRDVLEPGVAGIRVTAYLPDNTVAAFDDTLADGTYALNVPQNVPQVRIEFTNIPDYLRSGPFGGQSDTTVTFVDCNGPATVNLATANPGQFCHSDQPTLVTSCFVVGDQFAAAAANQPTVISFPYTAGGLTDPTGAGPYGPGSSYDLPAHPTLAFAPQTGSVFGVAHQRSSDNYFLSSHMKRHSGFGPGAGGQPSSGVIYRVTPAAAVSILVDLNAIGINTGADPHPPTGSPGLDWQIDAASYPLVSKMSLGDLDISEDDRFLYTVNLFSRSLVRVPIAAPNTATQIGIPNPGCVNGQHRPFGLGIEDTLIYIGIICDASTGTTANLDAYVVAYDPNGGGFNTVFRMDMDYPRRCADGAPGCAAARAADWRPWTDTWTFPNPVVYPQPILADIEFDNGDLILGFRDRIGSQAGNQQRSPNVADAALYNSTGAGDILRACSDGAGGWILEANATCGTITTAGNVGDFEGQGPADPNLPIGPGNLGGEYYYTDNNAPSPYADRHDEISLGGLLQLPGAPDVVSIVFDPVPFNNQLFDGGVAWFSNADGTRTRSYRIYNGGQNDATLFGKGEGLGSLEAACGPAPIEIGNRVWEDLDRNGQQDPGEVPLAGVVVSLYDVNDVLIATTTTNAEGEYIFNEATVFNAGDPRTWLDINGDGVRNPIEPAGIMPLTDYTIRLDSAANYGGGPLTPYFATPNNSVLDLRDSDGAVPNFAVQVSPANAPEIALTTGLAGENDHTYDFGFSLQAVTPTPPLQTPPAGTPPPGVEVVKSAAPPFAGPGDTVTWTITVTGTGAVPTTNLVVSDTLPGELIYVSHSTSTGSVSVSGQTVTWTIPVVNPGAVLTLTITTRIRSDVAVPFSITNVASGASASVLSVSKLPATGESFWSFVQPLVIMLGIALVAGFVVIRRRKTRKI